MAQRRSTAASPSALEAERASESLPSGVVGALIARRGRIIVALLSVIALILVGAALRATYPVTMPLVLAFFLAVLVHPVECWLREHLPARLGWLSLILTMLLILAVLAFFAGGLWLTGELVANRAGQYVDQLQQYWQSLRSWALRNNMPLPQASPGEGGGMIGDVARYFAGALTSLGSLAGTLVLVFFFILLMLLETSIWRRKAQSALAWERAQVLLHAVEVIAVKIRRFLLIRTVLGLISGAIAALWLFATGIDFWYLWGFLFFALNYIPNVGSIIAAIPPALMALIQFDLWWALVVIAGLTVSEQLIGNYIDPRLQGRTLNISPLVILVSVIFWGWIWGPAGAVLAVPIMASVIIACTHIESLRPVALLLAGSADEDELDEQMHEGA